jgi:hypothetical protein
MRTHRDSREVKGEAIGLIVDHSYIAAPTSPKVVETAE